MRELSLFSGAGGGLLGTHLLGWRPIGYVEYDDYCQRVIAQRIKDGILPVAPIFTDVREFVQSGAAAEYRGFADVVTAGFPCQPFSVAGKRRGADDERNMWPATMEIIRAVRPHYAFMENVPGLLSGGYFGSILADLAESGYDARWRILSAAEVGAPHKRDRLWIVAYPSRTGTRLDSGWASRDRRQEREPAQPSQREMVRQKYGQVSAEGIDTGGEDVAHAQSEQGGRLQSGRNRPDAGAGGEYVGDTTSERLSDWTVRKMEQSGPQPQLERPSWWEAEPALGRVVDGYAGRVDELKAIGDAQVASVAATAWRLLTGT